MVTSIFSLLVLGLEHLLFVWSAALDVVGHLNLWCVLLELNLSGEAVNEVGVGNLIPFEGTHLHKRCILASAATRIVALRLLHLRYFLLRLSLRDYLIKVLVRVV